LPIEGKCHQGCENRSKWVLKLLAVYSIVEMHHVKFADEAVCIGEALRVNPIY
jgi:biotin carboxylase